MAGEEGWWEPELLPDLSQGDILADVPLGTVTAPIKYLRQAILKGGSAGWSESLEWVHTKDGLNHYLERGKRTLAVVMSWGCQIDKPTRTKRLQVALVSPMAGLNEEERRHVAEVGALHSLVLPGIPGRGDHYIDLRCVTYFPDEVVRAMPRVASMTESALTRLHAQIVAYYTRLRLEDIKV